jgi:hypothetical protein
VFLLDIKNRTSGKANGIYLHNISDSNLIIHGTSSPYLLAFALLPKVLVIVKIMTRQVALVMGLFVHQNFISLIRDVAPIARKQYGHTTCTALCFIKEMREFI